MAMKNGGYLGRVPGNSAVVLARQNYAPSGVTTDFTFSSGYSVGYIDAYINGVRQLEGEDYYATDGTTLTFNDANELVIPIVLTPAIAPLLTVTDPIALEPAFRETLPILAEPATNPTFPI